MTYFENICMTLCAGVPIKMVADHINMSETAHPAAKEKNAFVI